MLDRKTFTAGALAVLLALASVAGLAAQQRRAEAPEATDVSKLPGYVDAKSLDIFSRDDRIKVEVNLRGAMIRFMAEALRGADEGGELSEALGRIQLIRFNLYTLAEDEVSRVASRAAAVGSRLEGRGWQRVVRVNDDTTQADLFLRTSGDNIIGLVAFFVDRDPNEPLYGFINLAGVIDPEQVGRIGRQYNIEVLEDFDGEVPDDD